MLVRLLVCFALFDLGGFGRLKDFKSVKQFSTDLKELDLVLSWFDELKQPHIPKKVWLQCQLALAEGFTNAVRHAHKSLSREVPIDIEIILYPHCLEMRIWDHGAPFDLEEKYRNLQKKVDEQAGGGRGIAILQRIADQLSYKRTADNRNCLLIVKDY